MGDAIRFQTAHLWWSIDFDRHDRHTTAAVTGRSLGVARPVIVGQPIEPERCEQFTFTESNQDALMDRIRAEIVRLDGPITKGDPED